MIETDGAYLLVLILDGFKEGGLTSQIIESFAACKAILTHLEPVRTLTGYCVAATVI